MFLFIVSSAAVAVASGLNGRAATYADLVRGPVASTSSTSQNYTKTTFDMTKYPLARCLDGGPGAVYVRPAALPSGANKYKIFFQGGAIPRALLLTRDVRRITPTPKSGRRMVRVGRRLLCAL